MSWSRIIRLLLQIQKMASADTTPEQVCRVYGEIRNRFDAVVAQAEPGAVALAMRLDKRLASEVERAEEFYGTLGERQRLRRP